MEIIDFIPIPCFILILYLVAELLKFFVLKTDQQKTILPIICAIIGGIAAGVCFVVSPGLIPGDDILTAIGEGIVSGLCATGANQVYKQLKKSFTSADADVTQ